MLLEGERRDDAPLRGPAVGRRTVRGRVRRFATVAALLALLAPGAGLADEHDDDVEGGVGRYQLTRTRLLLVRTDSATGQVWVVPVSGDGGWLPLGEAPDPAGAPLEVGRYRLTVMGAGGGRRGQPGPVQLLLADRATGRAWLADSDPDGAWSLIGGASGLPSP